MHSDVERFLNLKHFPGRLPAEQAAWFIGFQAHEIPILVAKGLLKPLGRPAANGHKYFLTSTLEELRRDEKWYNRASDAIIEYWRQKNARYSDQLLKCEDHSAKMVELTEERGK